MIIAPSKKEYLTLKLVSIHSNLKQWLLEYVNPLWNVHNDSPVGNKEQWRTSCWRVRSKK